jgi:hypothetical protein
MADTVPLKSDPTNINTFICAQVRALRADDPALAERRWARHEWEQPKTPLQHEAAEKGFPVLGPGSEESVSPFASQNESGPSEPHALRSSILSGWPSTLTLAR